MGSAGMLLTSPHYPAHAQGHRPDQRPTVGAPTRRVYNKRLIRYMKEVLINNIRLVNADSLQFIKTLPDNSIDLIPIDPPYFRVKTCAWDNQWDNEAAYLAWLDDVFAECWRVLKPTGSLYVFCSSQLSADTEILMRERFKILSRITWAKPKGPWLRQDKSNLRSFFPSTERILFAEHYGAEGYAKGSVGYGTKCQELKGDVFQPLIEYFRSARTALCVTAKDIDAVTGTQMCSHWFSSSQWQLPNETQYKALQGLFERVAKERNQQNPLSRNQSDLVQEYGVLKRDYEGLIAEYSDLKQQYENLRRPFTVSKEVPYIDVWTYPPVQTYKGKHPCEKPAEMMRDIINASSRPGEVVADFFMGSGSTLKAARALGRAGIGVELEEERFNQTVSEMKST